MCLSCVTQHYGVTFDVSVIHTHYKGPLPRPTPNHRKETPMKLHSRTVMRETADLNADQLRFILCYLMPYIEQGRSYEEAQEILMNAIDNEKREAGEAA